MTKPFRMPGSVTFTADLSAPGSFIDREWFDRLAARVPRCACGKPATHELTDTVEGEAEPRSREPMCEDCAAWIIDGAPVRGNA